MADRVAASQRLAPRDLGKAYCNVFVETAALEVVAPPPASAAGDARRAAPRSGGGHPARTDTVIDLSGLEVSSTPLRQPADALGAAQELLVVGACAPAPQDACSHRQAGQLSSVAMVALAGLGVLTVLMLAAGVAVVLSGHISP